MRRLGLEDDVEPWDEPVRRRSMPLWQELPLLLIVAFCVAVLIRTFLLQAFYIPSGSMEDTLLVGDRVLVNKVIYHLRDPKRGEVIVFHGTDAWAPVIIQEPEPGALAKVGRTLGDLVGVGRPGERDYIKRVIGLPGDRVRCCDKQGRVTVNGVALDETYVVRDSPMELPPDRSTCRSRRFEEVVVPPGNLFVMGDHRLVSQDARCQGTVPIDNVIGRAFVIIWPSSRWTSFSVPETFDNVPNAASRLAEGIPGDFVSSFSVDHSGGAGLVLPILGPLVFAGGSRQRFPLPRRRLHP